MSVGRIAGERLWAFQPRYRQVIGKRGKPGILSVEAHLSDVLAVKGLAKLALEQVLPIKDRAVLARDSLAIPFGRYEGDNVHGLAQNILRVEHAAKPA